MSRVIMLLASLGLALLALSVTGPARAGDVAATMPVPQAFGL